MSPKHIYAILGEHIWFHVWYLYVQGFVLMYIHMSPIYFFIITKIGLNIICYIMFSKIMQVPLIDLQWEKSPCGEGFLFLMDAIMIHFHLYES